MSLPEFPDRLNAADGSERCHDCRVPFRVGEVYVQRPDGATWDIVCTDCTIAALNGTQRHRCEVWRDDTAPLGHGMAWRARCTCMGRLPRDPGWKPHWAACCHPGALGIVTRHLADPHPDDWLELQEAA